MTFLIVAAVVAVLIALAALAWWSSGRARPRQVPDRTRGEAANDSGAAEWHARTGPKIPPTAG